MDNWLCGFWVENVDKFCTETRHCHKVGNRTIGPVGGIFRRLFPDYVGSPEGRETRRRREKNFVGVSDLEQVMTLIFDCLKQLVNTQVCL